jgi:hypothetical protein
MLAVIGAALQLLLLVLGKLFSMDAEKKAKAKEILSGVKGAKDVASITRTFDAINRL